MADDDSGNGAESLASAAISADAVRPDSLAAVSTDAVATDVLLVTVPTVVVHPATPGSPRSFGGAGVEELDFAEEKEKAKDVEADKSAEVTELEELDPKINNKKFTIYNGFTRSQFINGSHLSVSLFLSFFFLHFFFCSLSRRCPMPKSRLQCAISFSNSYLLRIVWIYILGAYENLQ
jgi:hypothetical protein